MNEYEIAFEKQSIPLGFIYHFGNDTNRSNCVGCIYCTKSKENNSNYYCLLINSETSCSLKQLQSKHCKTYLVHKLTRVKVVPETLVNYYKNS